MKIEKKHPALRESNPWFLGGSSESYPLDQLALLNIEVEI